jgi:hypothetical protein
MPYNLLLGVTIQLLEIVAEQTVFWIYYTLRCMGFMQSAFHSLFNSHKFHEAEPKCGEEGDKYQEKGGVILDTTFPYVSKDGLQACYSEYSGTLSAMYALYGVLALT